MSSTAGRPLALCSSFLGLEVGVACGCRWAKHGATTCALLVCGDLENHNGHAGSKGAGLAASDCNRPTTHFTPTTSRKSCVRWPLCLLGESRSGLPCTLAHCFLRQNFPPRLKTYLKPPTAGSCVADFGLRELRNSQFAHNTNRRVHLFLVGGLHYRA